MCVKEDIRSLELEFQVFVCCLIWVVEIKFGSFARTVHLTLWVFPTFSEFRLYSLLSLLLLPMFCCQQSFFYFHVIISSKSHIWAHGNEHLQGHMNELKGKTMWCNEPHYSFYEILLFLKNLFLFLLFVVLVFLLNFVLFCGGGFKGRGWMWERGR